MLPLNELVKAMLREPRPMELEFTRMLLDVRGASHEDIDRFFKKIGKRPRNVGDPIEVRHTRQFSIIPGLFPNHDPYKSALFGATEARRNMGFIYDLSLVMLRMSMGWGPIESALNDADARFGYLLGISADHQGVEGGQKVTVSLIVQPFAVADSPESG